MVCDFCATAKMGFFRNLTVAEILDQPNEPQPSPDDSPKDSDLTPRRQLYLEYWTAHRKHLEQRNGVIKPVKPNKGHWIYFSPFHDTGFCLGASASVKYK